MKFILFLSNEAPMIETLDFTFHTGKDSDSLTYLTMVVGRQFGNWSSKLGYFNFGLVITFETCEQYLPLTRFQT